jgi:7-cyano-7-deazaguanine synthase in queuosine biosynthesis
LDSFIGSIDILSRQNEKPFFVSHYKTGTESTAQDALLSALGHHFGISSFDSHRFYIQPNQQNESAQKENSSRARSLLFISLGLTIANSLGDDITLILPENGLISLNIPLTKTRLSSHSTRTTHPYFIDALNKITASLGIPNRIFNPYRFKTKGEMMQECADLDFLNQHVPETVSCSHPENSRYLGKPPGLNCGYCVPCIIRQAAEKHAGNITTDYALDDIRQTPPSNHVKKGADYRAFKIALKRLEGITRAHSLALEVIRSGPIPTDNESPFEEYVSVYRRGMGEVNDFLNG